MTGGARAQSEALGTVLLLGLTVAVVGTTVAIGGAALDGTQQRADLQRVEGAMTQVDSKASLVAHGESPSQRARRGLGPGAGLRGDGGAGGTRPPHPPTRGNGDGDPKARNRGRPEGGAGGPRLSVRVTSRAVE